MIKTIARWAFSEGPTWRGAVAILVLIFAVTAAIIAPLYWLSDDRTWPAECRSRGGHVYELRGRDLCLADDGRVLEW